MLRMICVVCGAVLPMGLLVIGIAARASAALPLNRDARARQACTGDAMRLCSDFVPDAGKVTGCMMGKRAQLSPQCRIAMARGHRGYGTARGGYRHYGSL